MLISTHPHFIIFLSSLGFVDLIIQPSQSFAALFICLFIKWGEQQCQKQSTLVCPGEWGLVTPGIDISPLQVIASLRS